MTLILIFAVAVIAFFAWRGARQRLDEARAALKRKEQRDSRAVTLERDPETGVYRERGSDD